MVLFSGGTQLLADLFEQAVSVLAILRRVNDSYKAEQFRVEPKEFVNPAVS